MNVFTENRKKKQITNSDMHANHLMAITEYKNKNGQSATLLQNQRHQQKQFEVAEARHGRSAGLVSKWSKRKLKKIAKANTVCTKKPDNKCQDKARTKALCILNAYSTACVRFVEREGERKDVPAELAKTHPVSACISYTTHTYISTHMYVHSTDTTRRNRKLRSINDRAEPCCEGRQSIRSHAGARDNQVHASVIQRVCVHV